LYKESRIAVRDIPVRRRGKERMAKQRDEWMSRMNNERMVVAERRESSSGAREESNTMAIAGTTQSTDNSAGFHPVVGSSTWRRTLWLLGLGLGKSAHSQQFCTSPEEEEENEVDANALTDRVKSRGRGIHHTMY
jgi:hypothetical protein